MDDEGKYRCLTCQKMFKSAGYVCKHISNKHPELLNDSDLMYEVGHSLTMIHEQILIISLRSFDCTTTLL